eukprot:g3484.t1
MIYGAQVWDPVLIVAQITTIQCLFYFSIGIIEIVVLGQFVTDISLSYVFDWRKLALKNLAGVITVLAHLLSAALTSIYIVHVVERSKKCLDFSSTVYIIHLLLCSCYSGLPSNIEWWAVNSFGLGLMALLSEWMCIKKELQEIPLSTFRYRNANPLQQGPRVQQMTTITN